MKKRLLACVLSCLLVFRLSVPAFANGAEYLEDDMMGVVPESYPVEFPDDIKVNPEDYIIDSGLSDTSLGLTLSIGQIAALIFGGVGVVYASSNWDALGSHLQSALSEAAELSGGAAALTYWLGNAAQGDIRLSSAPFWILQTILNTCYSIHQGMSYPTASPIDGLGLIQSGQVVSAGSTINGGLVADSTGYVGSYSTFTPYADCYVYKTYDTYYTDNDTYYYLVETFHFFSVEPASSLKVLYKPRTSSVRANTLKSTFVGADGLVYAYGQISALSWSSHVSYSTTIQLMNVFLNKYYVPGGVSASSFDPLLVCADLYGSAPYYPSVGAWPVGNSICPDALVGGISQAWTNDSLDAGVIDLPDILIDGSGVITGTDTATLDTSIITTLDKVATGELAWDDYWIDIADSVPTAKVEDTTTGDIVNRPISPDGTLQDPVVVPEYSTDLKDYTLDLKGIFPFCIPFDLYNFLSCLAADPEAPKWSWSLPVPLTGESYEFEVDLSRFDEVALTFRSFEILLFIVGLGLKTRDIIKG